MNKLILAIILSMLPVSELRGGLPLGIVYALENNFSIPLVFVVVLLANMVAVFLVYLFLEVLHKNFMKIAAYRKAFGIYLERVREKIEKVEKKMKLLGFFALTLFVAIPLPVTGAWTGTFIAWFLGLEKKKAIPAILLGILIAGTIVLLATLGIIGFVNIL